MRDEVIEEIRERRKRMLREEFDGSIKHFGDKARQWQHDHPDRIVNLHDQKNAERKARHA